MRSHIQQQRKWIAIGAVIFTLVAIYWFLFSSGMPVIWGPTASAKDIAAGRELFEHEWTPHDPLAKGDGLGPVFNAKSCASCHFQGGLGGGGELSHNATGFEILPRPDDLRLLTGTIHNYSVNPSDKESFTALRKQYPIRKGRVESRLVAMEGCPPTQQQTLIPDFDPVRTQSVQSTAMFGAGWIDLISEKAIIQNHRDRSYRNVTQELSLNFEGVPVGKIRTLADGRIGRFGWKAQFASLDDFVATACANELGLGTPYTQQVQPFSKNTPSETPPDLDKKQFSQLMAFCSTLPKPVEVAPTNAKESQAAKFGKELFTKIGCATCHVPDIGGVKSVYSDFLLYTLDDPPPPGGTSPYGPPPPPELPRPDDLPLPSEWKTPALWGVADSAPYFHDGTAMTLHDAILRHNGEGKGVKKAYLDLTKDQQEAVIAFLNTLKAPHTATPLRDVAITVLPKKK
jgi:CxxC motif-containing protein (DUF1111 family)